MATKKKGAKKNTPSGEKFPKKDVWQIPFKNLKVVEGFNIRTDYGDIKQLANSIEQNGVKVALQGHKEGDFYVVTDGHRRYAACKILHDKGVDLIVPFICEPKGTNEEARVANMFTLNDGKPLNPLERAEGVRRLLAYGWTNKQIGEAMGQSGVYVDRLNKLNTAPKKFIKIVADGDISPTLAIQIAGEGEGAINDFLAKYESGEVKATTSEDGKKKKIVAKDLKKVDSWKYFKKFSTTVDSNVMNNKQRDCYDFMLKVSLNQADANDFAEFFGQK